MTVLRYSLLRILLLFGCLLVLWIVGVRNPLWLLVLTAVSSLVLSWFLLKGPREAMARTLADRTAHRLDARDRDADTQAEDLEDDARRED